jgi:3-oxoacyl-[acyl-carrier-protein] synthase-3
MQTIVQGARIAGIAASVPARRFELESLSERFGAAEIRRIVRSTGVTAIRRATPGMRASDLCMAAAEALLADLRIERRTVDAVVFVSQTPDRVMPATSATLQARLGLSTRAAAFDINYGCSGYVYGLLQAALLIHGGGCRRVLVCAGDTVTSLLHEADRGVRMLFGDAGSATLVESGEGALSFVVHTDGEGAEKLIVPRADEAELAARLGGRPGHLFMDGGEVMNFALRVVPEVLAEILATKGWSAGDVGLYALHQASSFILQFIRRKLRLDEDAVPAAVEDTGNTGPASIPLLLTRVAGRYPKERLARTAMCGFGVGLSWGAAAVDLAATRVLHTLEI